jgi:hypothetical protein
LPLHADPGPLGNGKFTDGSMNFLNPALIYPSDLAVRTLVRAIHSSSVCQHGRTASELAVWILGVVHNARRPREP